MKAQGGESRRGAISYPPAWERFSLIEGGPLYRFEVYIRMAIPNRSAVIRRACLAVLITWLPLFVLSAAEGRLLGSVTIPFLYDIAVNVRFLITLPLLIVAETVVDPRVAGAVRQFVTSGLVTTDQFPAFASVVTRILKLRDSMIPAILLVIAAYLPSLWPAASRTAVSSWHTLHSASQATRTGAGLWFWLISLPLYRLLLFRWVWLIVLWTIFLFRTSKLDLRCVATHPDTAAGLGFLMYAQTWFGIVAFTASCVAAAGFADEMVYHGQTLDGLKFLIAAFCVLMVALFAAPLLVMTPKLILVKESGLSEYGDLGSAYVHEFDQKWVRHQNPDDALLGTGDIQSLADLYNSFTVVRGMRVVLWSKGLLLGLAVSVVLPMLVLIVAVTPVDQLLRTVLKVFG